MQKIYSRSQVIFNTEIVSTALDAPKTREEVREASPGVNIGPVDGGIGYQVIEINNIIA